MNKKLSNGASGGQPVIIPVRYLGMTDILGPYPLLIIGGIILLFLLKK
jgi:hypothetical protein